MGDHDGLAEQFEAHRSHLRRVAYRMLGSLSEADDAVQEAWLRFSRSDTSAVENLAGWLTRVVARICLDMLRSRASRREQPLGPHVAGGGPLAGRGAPGASDAHGARGAGGGDGVSAAAGGDPEQEAVLAESVGLALLVVLDTLGPAERVAFVLHEVLGVPFAEIAPIVERSPVATKKLASRARQRVRGTTTVPAAELRRQRHVVDAFISAARVGDIDGLLAVLAPDVVRRADRVAVPAGVATELRGARAVAEETRTNAARARFAAPALLDGSVGAVVAPGGTLVVALRLTVEGDRITEIEVVADPARLQGIDVALVPG